MKRLTTAAAALALLALSQGIATAAEPIVGRWRLSNGETTRIASCGQSYCITVETGKYKGKRIGRFSGSGLSYVGEVIDPESDKAYDGTVVIKASSLDLTGCAFKVFCRSQTWTRQR